MGKLLLAGFLFAMPFSLHSQQVADGTFWVFFTDKKENGFSYEQPEAFLSQRSVDRRAWQGLALTPEDEPVTAAYLEKLDSMGVEIRHVSRWLNGALMVNATSQLFQQVLALPFTDTLPWVPEPGKSHLPPEPSGSRFDPPLSSPPGLNYGNARYQVGLTETEELHQRGYTGSGVWIGILDNGFRNVDSLPSFRNMISEGRLLGTKNFVNSTPVFRENTTHGMRVLSAAGALWNDTLVGTAPHASYYLCMTENPASETMIEEFAWIEALEFLDSMGVDVINTSLGYSDFEGDFFDHTREDLDGNTTFISRTASRAAGKGIICCLSAGNEGNKSWYNITPPADASDVLTVGAADSTGLIAPFSSRGPSADGRVKPDITGMGWYTWLQDPGGGIRQGSGTSFSAPLITGSVASLWQAYPQTSAKELIEAVRQSGNSYLKPNDDYGYGIPSFKIAYWTVTGVPSGKASCQVELFPNPARDWFLIKLPEQCSAPVRVDFFDLHGRLAGSRIMDTSGLVRVPAELGRGLYILQIRTPEKIYHQRLILE